MEKRAKGDPLDKGCTPEKHAAFKDCYREKNMRVGDYLFDLYLSVKHQGISSHDLRTAESKENRLKHGRWI